MFLKKWFVKPSVEEVAQAHLTHARHDLLNAEHEKEHLDHHVNKLRARIDRLKREVAKNSAANNAESA